MIENQQHRPETESNNTESMVPDSLDSNSELATRQLRTRWELASVLNFFNVFGLIIGGDLKMSAEEIEMALISPNISLANLHIMLLKVAEEKFPLSSVKGYYKEDISTYKALDPTSRLLMLKALCELRADQEDTSSYINDALISGTEIPCLCHDKLGGDGKGTTYWYDGNTITGYRLYKAVKKFEPIPKLRNKDGLSLPAFSFRWETLATNLDEFRKVLDDLSSSKIRGEMPVAKTIEVDVIPILEKLQKRKKMALLRNQRKEKLLNDFKKSYAVGTTRSCRIRTPINYTYDEYDRAIDEAIQVTKRRKTDREQKYRGRLNESKDNIIEASDGNMDSGEDSGEKCTVVENGTDNSKLQGANGGDEEYIKKEGDETDEEYIKKEDDQTDEEYIKKEDHSEKENNNFGGAKNDDSVKEARNKLTRNRPRQRLTVKNECFSFGK